VLLVPMISVTLYTLIDRSPFDRFAAASLS
jgi:hypothetical protein